MEFTPTPEQKRIFKFIQKRPENILIEAYAGAGKTTTIVEAVNLLPKDSSIIFLAFNKHIKEELETRLPDHVRCYTSHGLGMSAIKRKYGDSIKFDEFKVDKHINRRVKKWGVDAEFKSKEDKFRYLQDIKKMVNLCRLSLTLDKKWIPYIAERYEVKLNEKRDVPRIMRLLDSMTQDRKLFDYTDMVYLPAVDPSLWLFPQDYVIIDECLPHKTYISTLDGKKQIGELYNRLKRGDVLPDVTTFNEELNCFESKKIEDVWCTGEKDVHYVVLNGKRKLKSTVNHRFLSNDGWKRLDELKIGELVLSNYNGQPYHQYINDTQKNIVVGSLLGDGNVQKISKHIYRLRVIHGVKQKEYIEWKSEFFNSDVIPVHENGYSKKDAYKFVTKTFPLSIDDLDKENKVRNLIPLLNEQSLAISWMDDANMDEKYNHSRLYATAESYLNTKLLKNKINSKWSIKSKICDGVSSTTGKQYYWLSFNKENTQKISNLLSQYIHKSMDYKLCPEDRGVFNDELWLNENNDLGCMVVTKEHSFHKKELTYDMTVQDNHNFIVTSSTMNDCNAQDFGVITHNCQDINRSQQRLIEKMLRRDKVTKKYKGRLIAIGDGFQSIYGFTGITDRTFLWFKEFQNTKVLQLSYSFRCAKNIIAHANKIVPGIKALPDAPDGVVRNGSAVNEARDGDFILCRKTMPLIKIFFEFLTQKKKAVIKGSDIGVHLIELTKGFNGIPELIVHWKDEVEKMKTELLKSGILNPNDHSGFNALEDKVNTLVFLASVSNTIPDLKHNIETIFTDKLTGIVLSTVHKAKGLESDRVFIIRPDLMPMPCSKSWQYAQEKNLEYVAITRAKNELIYDTEWTDEEDQ